MRQRSMLILDALMPSYTQFSVNIAGFLSRGSLKPGTMRLTSRKKKVRELHVCLYSVYKVFF